MKEDTVLEYPAYVAKELEFSTTIRKGDRGIRVRRVQEWLGIQGFSTPIDGDFGDATGDCVVRFQQKAGLGTTGGVNADTWDALVDPLTGALTAPDPSGSSLASTVLRVAKQHLTQGPIEVGGDNRGPWVRVYCGGNEGTEWRWCAGFVSFIIRQACLMLDRAAPLKGTYSCDSLAYQAKDQDLFVSGKDVADGTVDWNDLGAAQIFLVRRSATDWIHTGFSFSGADQTFATIEGNTNDDGSANGYEVCKRTRSLSAKDLIRFPD
jgi:Putative peptidoglycan binding domain